MGVGLSTVGRPGLLNSLEESTLLQCLQSIRAGGGVVDTSTLQYVADRLVHMTRQVLTFLPLPCFLRLCRPVIDQ